jgi:C-terminal processing protease CtpA/Prc
MKQLIYALAIGSAAVSAPAQTNNTDLGPTTELIGLLKSHFVDSDQLDAKRLTDATVSGLLQSLGEGVQILTTAQASSNTVSRPASIPREALARTEVIQPDIAYIRLADVTEATPAALDGELKKFLAAKVTGFVLDLRFADGTNYAAAAIVASRFISGEPDLFFIKANGRCQEMFRASEPSRILTVEPSDAPLMVLVNGDTRGAAEAVAAALRAQERAVVIGSRTAGQAIAWQDVPLSDGRVLRVATTKIAIAGGKDIFPGGVTPDIAVKIDEQTEREAVINAATNITLTASLQLTETKKAIREADLLKFFRGEALEAPSLTLGTNAPNIETAATNGLTTAETVAATPAPRREVRDTVLQRAVDILKGIRVLLSSR